MCSNSERIFNVAKYIFIHSNSEKNYIKIYKYIAYFGTEHFVSSQTTLYHI